MKKLKLSALVLLACLGAAQAQVNAPIPYRASALGIVPGQVKTIHGTFQNGTCYNPNGTVEYVQGFDQIATPTYGTTPSFSLPVSASGVTSIVGGPFAFIHALWIAASSGAAFTGTPAVSLTCSVGFN